LSHRTLDDDAVYDRTQAGAKLVLDILKEERPAVAVYALALVAGSLVTNTGSTNFAGGRIANAVLDAMGVPRPEDLEAPPMPAGIAPTPPAPRHRGTLTARVTEIVAENPGADARAVIVRLGLSPNKATRNKVSAILSRLRRPGKH